MGEGGTPEHVRKPPDAQRVEVQRAKAALLPNVIRDSLQLTLTAEVDV